MEEAAIYDEAGNVTNFDFQALENEFGNLEEFQLLEKEIENDSNKNLSNENQITTYATTTWKGCMTEALKDHFGIAVIEAALTGGFWAYLEKKAYKEAAKLLLKIGIGGNIIGLTAFLTYYSAKCLRGVGPWASTSDTQNELNKISKQKQNMYAIA